MSTPLPVMTTTGDATEPPPEGSRLAQAHLILIYFLAAALLVWLLSGIYQVKTDQVAIVERLGEYLKTPAGQILQVDHGLHYHLPWPIDRVSVISTQQTFTLQVDEFNTSPSSYADFKRDVLRRGASPEMINAIFDPYLITGDKSVVHVEISILFRINDAAAWLTSVSHEYLQTYDPHAAEDMRNKLFQQIAQRVIISQVARMQLDKVVREARAELERGILNGLQNETRVPDPSDPTGTKRISLGVLVQSVAVSVAQVPDAVKPAYDNLITQQAAASTVMKVADADKATAITAAEGEKSTRIADANAYRISTREAAKGESQRFSQLLEQFKTAPEITRWNLFVDAARTVAAGAKRTYIVQPGQKMLIMVDPSQFDSGQGRQGQ